MIKSDLKLQNATARPLGIAFFVSGLLWMLLYISVVQPEVRQLWGFFTPSPVLILLGSFLWGVRTRVTLSADRVSRLVTVWNVPVWASGWPASHFEFVRVRKHVRHRNHLLTDLLLDLLTGIDPYYFVELCGRKRLHLSTFRNNDDANDLKERVSDWLS